MLQLHQNEESLNKNTNYSNKLLHNNAITVEESQNLQTNSNVSISDNKSYTFTDYYTPLDPDNTSTSSIANYIPLICISIVVVLFLIVFSTIFAIINNKSNKILEGVSVNGIDLSGLTSEEATKKLSEEFSKKLDASLTLNYNDYTCEFIPSQDINASFDINIAVETAYSFGRTRNLIQNNYEILETLISLQRLFSIYKITSSARLSGIGCRIFFGAFLKQFLIWQSNSTRTQSLSIPLPALYLSTSFIK